MLCFCDVILLCSKTHKLCLSLMLKLLGWGQSLRSLSLHSGSMGVIQEYTPCHREGHMTVELTDAMPSFDEVVQAAREQREPEGWSEDPYEVRFQRDDAWPDSLCRGVCPAQPCREPVVVTMTWPQPPLIIGHECDGFLCVL